MTKTKSAIVAWKDKLLQLVAQAVEAEKSPGGFLSFKGGRLSYNDQLIPNDRLECIIVDAVLENCYYSEPYDPEKPMSPTCYAFGRREADMRPRPEAETPQSDFCAECPHNEWGSDPRGGRGKACKNTRRLAIISPSELTPDGIAKADIVFAKLPVTSVRNYSVYVNQVAVLGVPPFGVVTELKVVPSNKNLFEVSFKALRQIQDEDLLSALVAKNEAAAEKLIQPYIKNEELQKQSTVRKYSV